MGNSSAFADVQTGLTADPLKIVIYGENNAGKSTFPSLAPSPIYLDLEDNIPHIKAPKKKIKTFQEFGEFIKLLLREDHSYKTLVIDSAEALEQQIWKQICAEANAKSINAPPTLHYAQGHIQAASIWYQLLNVTLDELRHHRKMSIVFTVHSKIEARQDPLTIKHDRFVMRIEDRAAKIMGDWCNCAFFAVNTPLFSSADPRERVGRKRVMYTEDNETFWAKNVFNLPFEMDLNWPAFAAKVREFYKEANETKSTEKGKENV